jgi:hypothetical protein
MVIPVVVNPDTASKKLSTKLAFNPMTYGNAPTAENVTQPIPQINIACNPLGGSPLNMPIRKTPKTAEIIAGYTNAFTRYVSWISPVIKATIKGINKTPVKTKQVDPMKFKTTCTL